jgi:orotidine-5'-phosphate decarboxylase
VEAAVRSCGNPCVVGFDPTPDSLPRSLRRKSRSPASLAEAYLAFARMVVRGTRGVVPGLKVQVACFERLGWRGVRAYERTVEAARDAGLLVIGDVKRGDVPHTAAHYAAAHLARGGADAVTVHPFLGPDSLVPFLEALAGGTRGLFVLVRTSNAESTAVQGTALDRGSLCSRVARLVHRLGSSYRGRNGWSAVGAVVGATHPAEVGPLRRRMPRAPFLVPGMGVQGGRPRDILPAFDRSGFGALVVASRRVLDPCREARDPERSLAEASRAFAGEVAEALRLRGDGAGSRA